MAVTQDSHHACAPPDMNTRGRSRVIMPMALRCACDAADKHHFSPFHVGDKTYLFLINN